MSSSSTPRATPDASSPPLWRRILATLGGVFLGAVLLVAAWAKTLDPTAFAQQITNEGLDFLLPAFAVALIALAIEVFLGSALILGLRQRFILWPTAALVVFFLFLTGRAYWRHAHGVELPDTGCGCFGNLVERTPAEAFWQDLLLMVPALILAFLGQQRGRGRWRLGIVGLLTAAVVIVAWKAPELPLDDLATRLKPGVEVASLCVGKEADGTRECLDSARILPEVAEGEHLVVMADITAEPFLAAIETLNEYHWAGRDPTLWVLTDAAEEEIFALRFGHGPAFELREAPTALLAPLYRTLPRSFLTRDGRVVETFSGLPPIERWQGSDGTASEGVESATS